MTTTAEVSGWGRWPRRRCVVSAPGSVAAVAGSLGDGSAIARGLGRSYGDCAINPERVVATDRLDRFVAFDPASAELVVEAGASLAAIIEAMLPQGYFPAVTPGTKFVSVGGAIAADVHGKNHHLEGSFGDHVLWLDLMDGAGTVRRCSPQENVELFNATIGGMGLTGVVLRAAIRLKRVETGWIAQRTVVAPDLDAAMAAFEDNLDTTYSVAWIDCLARGAALGRSLVYLGEHALRDALPPRQAADPFALKRRSTVSVPVDAPSFALNPVTVGAFNQLYWRLGVRGAQDRLIDWDRYFYPLDSVLHWNRIYGTRGFAQYQCAIPLAVARMALGEMLEAITASGLGSFLAVLKRFGRGAAQRPLSFPIEGYTLALDFPLTAGALTLMDRLDEITLAAGGRLYMAKDSRMTQRTFEAGYGAGAAALQVLRRGPARAAGFGSLQSRRLGL